MGRILAARDIAGLYRVLKVEGVTQQTIAALTGQSQSEVSELLKGRRVQDVTVLELNLRRPGRSPGADGPLLRRARRLRWRQHGR